MNFKGKKLLVLAGAGVHSKVVETAKEMGIYTIVTDFLSDSPAKKIADESLNYNIFDIDDLVEYCQKNHIDGVLNFCIDPAQKPAQKIAERLNLPTFGTEDQVLKLTNKIFFKRLCIENGVDVIPELCEEEITNKIIPFPVIVKPVDSRGSRGTSVCNDIENLLLKLPIAKAESSNGKAIIEKLMTNNQDLTITYIVKNGEPSLISIGDRYSGREQDNLDRQLICTIQPSRFTEMYMKYVNEKVMHMIQYLGIQNGPVFMQGFVDGNTVRMYDPGIRFPGNEYERILKKATGFDPMRSIISYVLGGEIIDFNGRLKDCYQLNGLCAIQYIINVGPGKIAHFLGVDEILTHPCIIDVQQRHFVGDEIKSTGDIKHRAGEISILVERTPERMKEVILFVQSKLRILNENGENMLISPFDSKKINAFYAS